MREGRASRDNIWGGNGEVVVVGEEAELPLAAEAAEEEEDAMVTVTNDNDACSNTKKQSQNPNAATCFGHSRNSNDFYLCKSLFYSLIKKINDFSQSDRSIARFFNGRLARLTK